MDISTEVAAIQAASEGSELRQPIVDALTTLNSGTLPAVTSSDAGKILKVGASGWEVGEKSGYMPVPSATKQITENGTYDVLDYSQAYVSVSGGSGSTLITKNITANGTYDAINDNADGYSSVNVNIPNLFWSGGTYYGDAQGGITGSITISLSGKIGDTAIIVIMHRSALTVPNDFVLVDNRKNPMTSETGNLPQEISIYKKILSNNSETYTVSQANSTARMCACSFYFSKDPELDYYATQEMDINSNIYSYSVSNVGKPTLIIISNPYSSTGNVYNTMVPEQLYIMPLAEDKKWFNNTESSSVGFRMASIINNSTDTIVITTSSTAGTADRSINRAFIYTIG